MESKPRALSYNCMDRLPIAVHTYMYVPVPASCSMVRFTSQDEENMGFVLRFSSTVLANTLAYQREMLLRKHNSALLEMARNLFSSVSESVKALIYIRICTCM